MMWLRRISLFVVVNILVVLTISIVLNVLGVRPYLTQRGIDYYSLMIFCLVWGFGGAFISLALSRWMAKMMMRIQVIDPENPGDADQRWLLQTVHRLATKAGLATMPEVGFYESPDPNAFATGPGRNSALVAVSTGLFEQMDRDEVEGVLGHELTHVANGDMVTMTLLQGVINAFVMFFARVIAFALTQKGNDERRGNNYGMQYLVTVVLEMLLGILGMMIVMSFSRWREFRADAGGARLAGRAKMVNALKALKQMQESTRGIAQVQAEPKAIAAFKISSRDGMFSLFASHPPLEERITRLESGSEGSSIVS
jgi:heat shock protein HtpX